MAFLNPKALEIIKAANESLTRSEFLANFNQVKRMVRLAIEQLDARITVRLAQVKDGAPGPKGLKGDSIVGPQGPKGEKGEKGDVGPPGPAGTSPDVKEAVKLTLEEVIAEIDKRVPLLGDALRAGLETHVKDLISKTYGGMNSAVAIMQSGTLKAQTADTLNFKGAGAPTITTGANGVLHLDFPSGGGGFTVLTATETPDGNLKVFTFAAAAAQPSYLRIDGLLTKATSKSGTVNWTWNAGTSKATLTVPPQDDIDAIV